MNLMQAHTVSLFQVSFADQAVGVVFATLKQIRDVKARLTLTVPLL